MRPQASLPPPSLAVPAASPAAPPGPATGGLGRLARSLARRPGLAGATGVFALVLASALCADLVASDAPLAGRVGGVLYVLPALTHPPALAPYGLEELRGRLAPGDWLVEPPVPFGPNTQDRGHRAFEAPSGRHPLGTDGARRDVLSRLVHGARVTLAVGLGSVAVYVLVGTLLGAAAGYLGGAVDALTSRAIEVLLAVPTFFVLLALAALRDGLSVGGLVLVMGLLSWPRVARLTRAEARRVSGLELVTAAEALGLSRARVLLAHVLPNSLTPVIVAASFGVAWAVLTEASLSFLGFGVPDEVASWGDLMHGALRNTSAWWLMVFPGLALVATLAAANLAGDAARDALDPRARGSEG